MYLAAIARLIMTPYVSKGMTFCAIPANKDEEVCRIFFGGFCRQEGNASQAICEETITANPCIGNPFAPTCGISFKPDRADRLAFCSIGDNANLPLCETADINGGCLINPYGYCGKNFASARTERYDFCTIEANAGNPLCNNFTLLYCGFGGNAGDTLCADTITANPCIEDPFGDGCGADYLNARSSRINWCTIGTNANHPLCATGRCIQDPFTKSCVFGSYTQARDNRIDFCLQDANRDHALLHKVICTSNIAGLGEELSFPARKNTTGEGWNRHIFARLSLSYKYGGCGG